AALQRMVDLRPGAEAYSRIAHVRWLKGDLAGAIEAMEMAARATSGREPEISAWILVRLSGYYLQGDQPVRSLRLADAARKAAADFPPALLARGRALMATGQIGEAIEVLRLAAQMNPLPEYQWWLADALRAA